MAISRIGESISGGARPMVQLGVCECRRGGNERSRDYDWPASEEERGGGVAALVRFFRVLFFGVLLFRVLWVGAEP
jgi:hypothetical protein